MRKKGQPTQLRSLAKQLRAQIALLWRSCQDNEYETRMLGHEIGVTRARIDLVEKKDKKRRKEVDEIIMDLAKRQQNYDFDLDRLEEVEKGLEVLQRALGDPEVEVVDMGREDNGESTWLSEPPRAPEVGRLQREIVRLQTDQDRTYTALTGLKGEVAELKGEVAELKGEVAELKGRAVAPFPWDKALEQETASAKNGGHKELVGLWLGIGALQNQAEAQGASLTDHAALLKEHDTRWEKLCHAYGLDRDIFAGNPSPEDEPVEPSAEPPTEQPGCAPGAHSEPPLGPWDPLRKFQTQSGLGPYALVGRALMKLKPSPGVTATRWALVRGLFNLEPADAATLCRAYKLDPDAYLSTKTRNPPGPMVDSDDDDDGVEG